MLEATRAAGAMLIPAQSSGRALFAAATLVHGTVSFFWAAILTWVLPRERVLMGSVLAAAAIALLDLRVIAEEVETPEQREFLLEVGCEFIQGFLFSKPMAAGKLTRVLSAEC